MEAEKTVTIRMPLTREQREKSLADAMEFEAQAAQPLEHLEGR